MEEKSIFEMILDKEIESEIIYEDDEIFAINDINPLKNNITIKENYEYYHSL